MKDVIKLYNRDGADLRLERNGDFYYLKSDKDYVLDFIGITLDYDNESIFAIDPAGGPYLSVGSMVENKKILKIFEKDEFGNPFPILLI